MNRIEFSKERWEKIRETYTAYWDGSIDRAVAGVAVREKPPCREISPDHLLTQKNCNRFDLSPDAIADAIEANLSQYRFYGDAFPMFNMDCFGPGVAAAFLGADVDNKTGNVWFHPHTLRSAADLHFEYNPDNPWLLRVKEIYRRTRDRFEGNILMGMTDLGGVLDILSVFRPGENLLFDLYDEPQEVKRLIGEIESLWMRFYWELHEEIGFAYTDWSNLYSETPSYIIQSDFTYMISPSMFEEFALPTLRKNCRELDRTIYHLDGPGELPHLELLLSIPELNAIQWIPGEGNPPCDSYIDVYRKIRDAGKRIQLPWCGFEKMDLVAKRLGSAAGLFHPIQYFEAADKDYALRWLRHFQIESEREQL